MANESYFLFIIWSILGFLFFRSILRRDQEKRFGKSIVVWVALLALVLLIALIWIRQSMLTSDRQMMENIRAHFLASGVSAARAADESFISLQLGELEKANSKTMLMATGMFAFALVIMISNYTFMSRQKQESEKLANTDALTGVKSKRAYLAMEKDLDAAISRRAAEPFAVVVCDLNGLKYINDQYGHKAGDDYIRSASALICELFDHSPVFRTGGDEFVVLLRGRDYQDRTGIMEKLQAESLRNIGSDRVVISCGLSEYQSGTDETCHAVFERADKRMYEDKQALKARGARTR